MKKKELYWLFGSLVGAVILSILFFGVKVLQLTDSSTFNIHDTYFQISNSHLFMSTAGCVFFAVYLLRMLRSRYRNITANIVFILSGLFCIMILSLIIKPLHEYALSTGAGAHNLPINEDILNGFSLALSIIRIGIIVFVVLAMIKTRKKYIKNI